MSNQTSEAAELRHVAEVLAFVFAFVQGEGCVAKREQMFSTTTSHQGLCHMPVNNPCFFVLKNVWHNKQ